MTSQNIEPVGIRAVVEGLQRYLSGTKQMQAANAAIAQSEVNLERVSVASAQRIIASRTAVAASERNLAVVTRTANRAYEIARARQAATEHAVATSIVEAQFRIEAARARVAATSQASAHTQERALLALATAERRLENIQVQGAARVIAAQEAVKAAYTSKIERVVTSEAATAAAIARSQTVQLAAVASTTKAATASVGAAVASNIFTKAQLGLNTAITGVGKALIAVTGFSNRFAVSLKFGAATAAAFIAAFSIGAASKFETTLARIDVLTEATTQEVSQLREGILDLSKTVPKSPDELGATAYFVLSSGIKDLNQALKITELAAKASTIGLGSAEDVARTVTAVINAYGKENISAAQATDILVASVQLGSAEASEFAAGIGRLLGIAPKLGIEFDQLTSAIAFLTNRGLPANQATTALLGVINQLISPSDEAKETLLRFGTSIEEVRKDISEQGLNKAMGDLVKRFDDNIQAFETLFPEVRGLTGALQLFNSEAGNSDDILNSVRNSAGITEDSFKKVSETFAVQAGLLKNQLNRFLIDLGTNVLPNVTNAARDLQKAIEDNRQATVDFVTNGLKSVISTTGTFLSGLKTTINLLDTLARKFDSSAVAALGLLVAFRLISAHPLILTLSAIIFAVGLLNDKWEEVKLGVIALGVVAIEVFQKMALAIETGLLGPLGLALRGIEAVGDQLGILSSGDLSITEKIVNPQLENIQKDLVENAQKIANDLIAQRAENEKARKDLEEIALGKIKLPEIVPGGTDTNIDAAKKAIDALSDGIIDFTEAAELGIDAIQAGALEATVMRRVEEEAAFEFTKTLSRVANAFKESEKAAQKAALAIAKEALAKVKAAEQALFGAPTKEVADLQTTLAQQEETRAQIAARVVPQIEELQDQLDAIKNLGTRTTKARTDDPIVAEVIQKGLGEDARGAINDLVDSTKDEEAAIQEKIDSLQRELELADRQLSQTERAIALYETHNNVLQAQIVAADKTLLTQGELEVQAGALRDKMSEASGAVKLLADKIGVSVLTELDDMNTAMKALQDTITILNDDHIRSQFIRATDAAAASLDNFTSKIDTLEQAEIARAAAFEASQFPAGAASGKFITSPQTMRVGEGGRPELILPLSQPARSRELIRSLPPALAGPTFGSRSAPGSIFGDMNISGPTREYTRLAAKAEVDKAFRQQAADRRRAGL